MIADSQGVMEYIRAKSLEVKIFLSIFYLVGIVGMASTSTRSLFISLTPFSLLLSLALLVIYHQPVKLKKEIIVFPVIFLIAFAIEAAGVNTGRLFGNYSYGRGLGIKILGTPVMIGINWLLLVYCTSAITRPLRVHAAGKIFLSSLLMVTYDLIMEQVAPVMEMWQFNPPGVPLKNYVLWFALALMFNSFIWLTGIRIFNRMASFVFYIQIIFFIILTIILKIA